MRGGRLAINRRLRGRGVLSFPCPEREPETYLSTLPGLSGPLPSLITAGTLLPTVILLPVCDRYTWQSNMLEDAGRGHGSWFSKR